MALTRHASVSIIANAGEQNAQVPNVPTTVVRGLGATRFEAALANTLLKVNLEYLTSDLRDEGSARAKFSLIISADAWFEKPVASLAHFEAINSLVAVCARPGATVRLVAHVPGVDTPLGRFSIDHGGFNFLREYLDWLRLARDVAREAGINPVVPAEMSAKDVADIQRLHALLFRGEYRAPGKGFTLSVALKRKATFPKAKLFGEISARMHEGSELLPFLGAEVRINTRQILFTNAVLTKRRSKIGGGETLAWDGGEGEFVHRSDRYAFPTESLEGSHI